MWGRRKWERRGRRKREGRVKGKKQRSEITKPSKPRKPEAVSVGNFGVLHVNQFIGLGAFLAICKIAKCLWTCPVEKSVLIFIKVYSRFIITFDESRHH